MDTLRGDFTDLNSSEVDTADYDRGDDDNVREAPPLAIGTDERRMQVRAYNFWASLLGDHNFPSIEDLDPENLPDFGPHSVLLDFSMGIEDPSVVFLGSKLAAECGTDGPIHKLSDVPSRSLLSRITDHHMQIIANQAPIGFEAEFVNQRGTAIMYRGILLPFSSDGESIDFIFGVINWKELADQHTTDELLLEIEQALEAAPESVRVASPLTDWADGPVDLNNTLDLDAQFELGDEDAIWPEPAFGDHSFKPAATFDQGQADTLAPAPTHASDDDLIPSAVDPDTMELADWLASAREYALAAQGSEDRSRGALYAAIGRAYDFSLAALEQPEEFAELVADAGLTVQDRAPRTPLVKLVFGADYDKTRLTEYAAVLSHGHRLGLKLGAMASFLTVAPGGLKGLVAAERKLRREEEGSSVAPRQNPRERLARKLRKLGHVALADVASQGSEFTLLVARRLGDGQVVLLGEVSDDALLLERAARRLIG